MAFRSPSVYSTPCDLGSQESPEIKTVIPTQRSGLRQLTPDSVLDALFRVSVGTGTTTATASNSASADRTVTVARAIDFFGAASRSSACGDDGGDVGGDDYDPYDADTQLSSPAVVRLSAVNPSNPARTGSLYVSPSTPWQSQPRRRTRLSFTPSPARLSSPPRRLVAGPTTEPSGARRTGHASAAHTSVHRPGVDCSMTPPQEAAWQWMPSLRCGWLRTVDAAEQCRGGVLVSAGDAHMTPMARYVRHVVDHARHGRAVVVVVSG